MGKLRSTACDEITLRSRKLRGMEIGFVVDCLYSDGVLCFGDLRRKKIKRRRGRQRNKTDLPQSQSPYPATFCSSV